MSKPSPFAALLAGAFAAGACSAAPQQAASVAANGALPFVVTPVADFDAPWAMTFLPDGRMLVTEKKGEMLLVSADGKARQTVATIPVDAAGQGGLMDVVLAPDFRTSNRVYFSYSAACETGGKRVVLARGRLRPAADQAGATGGERLGEIEALFRGDPLH